MKVDNFWQPVVFYNLPIKVRFHQERQTFPFFCDKIFTDEKEAAAFLPFFIKELVNNNSLPEDVLNYSEIEREKHIKTAVRPLYVTALEMTE
jgi:hypothetical protein